MLTVQGTIWHSSAKVYRTRHFGPTTSYRADGPHHRALRGRDGHRFYTDEDFERMRKGRIRVGRQSWRRLGLKTTGMSVPSSATTLCRGPLATLAAPRPPRTRRPRQESPSAPPRPARTSGPRRSLPSAAPSGPRRHRRGGPPARPPAPQNGLGQLLGYVLRLDAGVVIFLTSAWGVA
jgi:hypothetical protein